MKQRNEMQSITFDGNKVISYQTHVATIEGNNLLIYGWYSATTSKHLNQLATAKGLNKVELKKSDNPTVKEQAERDAKEAESMMKTVGNFALMASFFSDNKADANKTKARILKAGLPGLSMPEDFDQLPEDEKERRLNGVIDIARK